MMEGKGASYGYREKTCWTNLWLDVIRRMFSARMGCMTTERRRFRSGF